MDHGALLILVSGGGFFIGIFVATLLRVRPRGSAGANNILSSFMILCSLNIVHPLIALLLPGDLHPGISYLAEPLEYLMAPLIAAYFRSLLAPRRPLRLFHLVHCLPFLAVVAFILSPLSAALEGVLGSARLTAGLWSLLVIQAFAYLLPSLARLHRYRRAVRNQVSNLAGLDLRWLMWFSHAVIALYLSYAVLLTIMLHAPRPLPLRGFLSLALTLLVCAIGYRGLNQRETPVVDDLAEDAPTGGRKYAKTALPAGEAKELLGRLERAMEEERLYLDPELSLSALSDRLAVGRNLVSYVINQRLGKNFFDFVNGYRVKAVIGFMEDPERKDDKLLTLGLEAGFNSKPTFNSVFKRLTGLTPSEFRRQREKEV